MQCLSQVRRLDQAVGVHREAIAFVVDVPADEVKVEARPEIPVRSGHHAATSAPARRPGATTTLIVETEP